MKKLLLLFWCLIIATGVAFAQDLQSRVVYASTNKPLKNVLVLNVNTNAQTYTDNNGYFTIKAKEGDRIKFSLPDYLSKELVLLDDWNVIDVITLEKKPMSGSDTAEPFTSYQIDSLERFRMYEHVLTRKPAKTRVPGWKEQKTGGPFVVEAPISGLLDKRSRKTKKRNQFKQRFYARENQYYVAYRYNDSLIQELTGLKDQELISFKAAYPASYAFCRSTGDLEFNSWIKYNHKQWLSKGQNK